MNRLLGMGATEAPLAVLDFETTGLSPQRDRVVEIAVVRTGTRAGTFHCLVDPEVPMPERVVAIHGLTDEDVRGQPTFAAVAPQLLSWLQGAVVVAHNAPFDLSVLARECLRAGFPCELGPVVDTLQLARRLFGFPHCNLPALCERAAVLHDRAHSALHDAHATLGVYRALVGVLEPMSVGELLERIESMRANGPGRRSIRKCLREAARDGHNLVIDYTSGAGGPLLTRREVTVTQVRPPYMEAFCHLRGAPRVFRMDRIQRVLTSS